MLSLSRVRKTAKALLDDYQVIRDNGRAHDDGWWKHDLYGDKSTLMLLVKDGNVNRQNLARARQMALTGGLELWLIVGEGEDVVIQIRVTDVLWRRFERTPTLGSDNPFWPVNPAFLIGPEAVK